MDANLLARFSTKYTVMPNGCWIWTSAVAGTAMKYGTIWHDGGPKKAHKLSFEHYKGPLPDGMRVLHNCPAGDNSLCVNPEHLWAGTQAQNMQDAVAKGRMNVNRHHDLQPSTKVTEAQIAECIRMREQGCTLRQIGDVFGVDLSTIGRILRKAMNHVGS